MKKVVFIVNHHVVIYNFRKEIVRTFLKEGVEVHIVSPAGPGVDKLVKDGAIWHDAPVDRHGTSIMDDFKLMLLYRKMLKEINPDLALCYTIKPNIYGGFAAKSLKIPYVVNITGLSSAIDNGGKTAQFVMMLYRFALRKVQRIFFQNKENLAFFKEHNLTFGKEKLLPGSGVNLEEFKLLPLPEDKVRFVYVARIMREKGIDEYLEAAEAIKKVHPDTEFWVCGFSEEDYKDRLKKAEDEGFITYKGMVDDIRTVLKDVSCIVHPSFYPEGISNAILESIASGRGVITTDMPGCRDLCVEGVNGYIVQPKDSAVLISAIEKYLKLSYDERVKMGLAGRKLAEEKFDRTIVINACRSELELGASKRKSK